MPQSSYRKPLYPVNTRFSKTKQISAKEIEAFKSYYDVKSAPDHAFRDEHYVVDEFIYKNKNNNAPLYGSQYLNRTKPITCSINSLINDVQSRKSTVSIKKAQNDLKSGKKLDEDPTKVPMDWNRYHRLAVIHNFMDGLEVEFPSLCTTGVIGKSLENRDLKILKISNSDASNSRVWIDSGIHAREWIAPAVSTFVANYIARNFDSLPESVRNKDWYFMPVLNPDGYEYTHTTNRMWRKNKANIRHELVGVDLNRNFSLGWGGKGSSDEPKHSFYRGPRPFSEPETAAMKKIFINSGITFKVYITLHSYGQVIIMPFAYRDDLARDYIRLLEGATVMSKAIYNTNGNTYKVGISKDVMYQASGTSNDWSHGEVGIPFCYLIELRSKKHKFKVPQEEIAETGQEILNCVIALMEFVDNYKVPEIEKQLNQAQQEKEKAKENLETDKCNKNYQTDVPKVNIRERPLRKSENKGVSMRLRSQTEVQVDGLSEESIPEYHQAEVQVNNFSNVRRPSRQAEVQVNTTLGVASSRQIEVQASSRFSVASGTTYF